MRRSSKRAARPEAPNGTDPSAKSAAATTKAGAPASKARAKAKPKSATKAPPKRQAQSKTPAEPKVPRRTIPPAGYASPTSRAADDSHSAAAELIGTTVQAAGELAQIGFAVGRQALQSMIDRLPKP